MEEMIRDNQMKVVEQIRKKHLNDYNKRKSVLYNYNSNKHSYV